GEREEGDRDQADRGCSPPPHGNPLLLCRRPPPHAGSARLSVGACAPWTIEKPTQAAASARLRNSTYGSPGSAGSLGLEVDRVDQQGGRGGRGGGGGPGGGGG